MSFIQILKIDKMEKRFVVRFLPLAGKGVISKLNYFLGGLLGFLEKTVNNHGYIALTSNFFFFYKKQYFSIFLNAINSLLKGLEHGYFIDFRVNGVGYKIEVFRYCIAYELGHSHYVLYKLPDSIFSDKKKYRGVVFGNRRSDLYLASRHIKNISYPDAYKGKGFRYSFEVLKLKVGKQRQK